jgi:simple sugar transport system ATP-binding protein
MGDRIAVMHAGQITPAREAKQWSREAIGLAMAGADASSMVSGSTPHFSATAVMA